MVDWDRNARDILNDTNITDVVDEDDDEKETVSAPSVTLDKASDCAKVLRDFCLQQGQCKALDHIMRFSELLTNLRLESHSNQ